jgi:hypothetical protein
MAGPIDKQTREIWHLSIEDLFAPLPEKTRLGGPGPFVINLSASTAPIDLPVKSFVGYQYAHAYQVQRTEDRRVRYRLRLGPFDSEDAADAVLEQVRDVYPGALTATVDADDRRALAPIQAKIKAKAKDKAKAKADIQAKIDAKARAEAEAARAEAQALAEAIACAEALKAEALARAEAQARAEEQARAEALAKAEAEAQARAEALARAEAEAKARAEALAKAEAEAKARAEAEAKARAEAQARAEAEAKARAEALAKAEAEAKARAEAEAKARAEALARAEAEAKARAEALAKAEAEAKARAEALAKAEAEAKARAEALAKAEAEAKARAEALAKAEAKARAEAQAREEARTRAEAEAKAEAKARADAQAEAFARAEAEVRAKAQAQAEIDAQRWSAENKSKNPGASPDSRPTPASNSLLSTVATMSRRLIPPKPAVAAPRTPPPAAAASQSEPPARPVEKLAAPLPNLESTQTIRALTSVELEDDQALRWFVIQLSQSEEAFDPDAVPNLDIFGAYRLYSVAGIDQGRIIYSLRLGFFGEEVSAGAVASYLTEYYEKPTIKRVSAAERQRFSDSTLEPRKDVGATGTHAIIEITNERYIREKRVVQAVAK